MRDFKAQAVTARFLDGRICVQAWYAALDALYGAAWPAWALDLSRVYGGR